MSGATEIAYVALGSNLGDRERHLDDAVRALSATEGVELLRVSRWHRTAPVGGPPGQPEFLNGAVVLRTSLGARELLAALQSIERAHGRDRALEVRHGPRPLDLDLLLHGDLASEDPDLSLPHPGLEDRRFVLVPLADVASDLVLPRSRQRVADRLRALAQSTAHAS